MGDHLAGHVEPTLQVHALQALAADEGLAHDRLAQAGNVAQTGVVGRHVAPSQQPQPVFTNALDEQPFALSAKRWIPGQKYHGHAVLIGRRQFDRQALNFGAQELVGNLQENTGSVARRFVGPRRSAMHQIH